MSSKKTKQIKESVFSDTPDPSMYVFTPRKVREFECNHPDHDWRKDFTTYRSVVVALRTFQKVRVPCSCEGGFKDIYYGKWLERAEKILAGKFASTTPK